MINNSKIQNVIDKAVNWLLESGIQNDRGGVFAWYNADKKEYSFVYSEITGYAITLYLYLYKIKKDIVFLEKAKKCADWLINNAFYENKGIRCRYFQKEEMFLNLLCSFDNGICLNGLCNLYAVTKNKIYFDFAKKIADLLVSMQKKDGSFYAKYDITNDKYFESFDSWSMHSGSFHNKIAISLLNFAKISNDLTYKVCAENVCRWSLSMQQKDGRFITNKKEKDTYMHPHCYSIEGLVSASLILAYKKEYIDNAISGLNWILNNQLENGGVPYNYNDKFFSDERVDCLSQTIRLCMYLHKYIDTSKIDKLICRLLEFQCNSDDEKTNGGFYYGQTDGKIINHVNTHATMFAIQALTMYIKQKQKIKLFYIV